MDKIQEALKERYSHLHHMIFYRSAEKARTNGELFDILEDYPKKYPVVWDHSLRRWVHTEDLTQISTIPKEG